MGITAMNEKEARKHIRELKGFYGHLMSFIVVTIGLAVFNIFTYLQGDPAIWVILPFVIWGGWVFMHGWNVHNKHRGRKWEEEKFRELTGWSASGDELDNLSARVDILLSILTSTNVSTRELDIEEARTTLEDVKRTIEFYQSPLDRKGANTIEKDQVIGLVERLEAMVTSREFRQLDADLN